jgi:hypothetical protein
MQAKFEILDMYVLIIMLYYYAIALTGFLL